MEERKYRNSEYVYGTAVRKLAPQWETPQEEAKRPYLVEEPDTGRRQKVKVGHAADRIVLLLLVMATAAALAVCFGYLRVQSDIVQLNKAISSLNSQITEMNKENDALEAFLTASEYDLEYIYQIAVGTLGMVYPNHNEVIYYENEDTGYFRQYRDIPK